MQYLSSCSVCSVFEWLQLPWLGNLLLGLGGVLAVFSLFFWPLMIVWPVLLFFGFGLVIGHGACAECHISSSS